MFYISTVCDGHVEFIWSIPVSLHIIFLKIFGKYSINLELSKQMPSVGQNLHLAMEHSDHQAGRSLTSYSF